MEQWTRRFQKWKNHMSPEVRGCPGGCSQGWGVGLEEVGSGPVLPPAQGGRLGLGVFWAGE